MAKLQLPTEPTEFAFQPGKALSLPLGVASPLWFAYAGAAAAGAAYWWMSRWASPTNLEALGLWSAKAADAADTAAEAVLDQVEVVAETVETAQAEVAEVIVELAPEPLAEAVAETLTAAMPEPVAEPEPPAPEPVAEATPEPETVAAPAQPPVPAPVLADDLTRIVGIGPKLSASLAERGVTTFAQIAAWQAAELEAFDKAMDLKGRAVRDAWIAQAKRFSEAESPAA